MENKDNNHAYFLNINPENFFDSGGNSFTLNFSFNYDSKEDSSE